MAATFLLPCICKVPSEFIGVRKNNLLDLQILVVGLCQQDTAHSCKLQSLIASCPSTKKFSIGKPSPARSARPNLHATWYAIDIQSLSSLNNAICSTIYLGLGLQGIRAINHSRPRPIDFGRHNMRVDWRLRCKVYHTCSAYRRSSRPAL